MSEIDKNLEAQKQLADELAELGIEAEVPNQIKNKAKEEDDEPEPIKKKGVKDEEEIEGEDEPKPKSKSKKEEDEEEEEDEPEKKPESKHRKEKYKPLPEYLSEKKAWKEREAALLEEVEELKSNKSLKSEKGEINDELKKFAEEAGIEDVETLQKLINLAGKGRDNEIEELKKAVSELSKTKEEDQIKKQVEAEEKKFNGEWENFEDNLKETYPNATKEDLKEAKAIMDELAHSKDWHKYDLDYIFFKNKKDFDDAVGVRKSESMNKSQTQRNTEVKKNNGGPPKMSDNPTYDELMAMDEYYSKVGNSTSGLKNVTKELIG